MNTDWRDYQRLEANADKITFDQSYNKTCQCITTNDVEQIILTRQGMKELVCTTKTIWKIDLEYCPDYIYLNDTGKLEDRIDLSKFDNLVDVRLRRIIKDIMFPGKLNNLDISQDTPNQFKILNDQLACKNISITSFDISNVVFYDCVTLLFQSVIYNNVLDLSCYLNLKDVILNNVRNNIILPNKFNKLHIILPDNNQYYILNRTIQCENISIINYNINNMEIKDCSSLTLTTCTANRLSLVNQQVDNLQIKLTSCEFKILDYSESNCFVVNDPLFFNNIIGKIILPNMIEKLQLNTCQMDEIIFANLLSIKSINIKFFPILPNNTIIDLSKFVNLKDIILHRIKNDIQLPNTLNQLELVQNEQFKHKILNNSISCHHTTIENFEFSNIEFRDCESLELWNCRVNELFLRNLNLEIKIRNSVIGICKFQEEVDFQLFLSNFQRQCKLVSYVNNTGNDVIFIVKNSQVVKSFIPQILTLKIDSLYAKINSVLDQ